MHDFSVWLRTDSNPADIYRSQNHTEKFFILFLNQITNTCLKEAMNDFLATYDTTD